MESDVKKRCKSVIKSFMHLQHQNGASLRGFTLIQMAILVLILGLMFGAAASQYGIYERQNYINATKERMDVVQQAIKNYFNTNGIGHLPCPADPTAAPATANYGRGNCATAGVKSVNGYVAALGGGNTNPSGGLGPPVLIGAVPVKDLGLANEYMAEPSGNLFWYAVTKQLTTAASYTAVMTPYSTAIAAGSSCLANCPGSIEIWDPDITPLHPPNLTDPDTITGTYDQKNALALYVLVSPGKDGFGSYNLNGVRHQICPGGATFAYHNCQIWWAGSPAQFYEGLNGDAYSAN